MQKQILSLVAALVLSSSLSACSGSAQVNVPNPIPGIQGYIASLKSAETPKSAVTTTKANMTVQQQAATDLVPYRCQFDQTTNAWIVFYYSPSKQKSYECRPRADKTVVVTEVTDVTMTYQQGDTIEPEKVTVDAAAACQTAAEQPTTTTPPATGTVETGATTPAGSTTTTTTTTTNVTINNVYLISAGELKKKHNRNSSNPTYVVVTNNQNVFVDASTGKTITATDGSAVNTGSGSATAGTTTTTTTTAQ